MKVERRSIRIPEPDHPTIGRGACVAPRPPDPQVEAVDDAVRATRRRVEVADDERVRIRAGQLRGGAGSEGVVADDETGYGVVDVDRVGARRDSVTLQGRCEPVVLE